MEIYLLKIYKSPKTMATIRFWTLLAPENFNIFNTLVYH